MKTIYKTEIPNELTCKYLDLLVNKVFALLPMFEEANTSNYQKRSFIIYQKNLIQTINGNTELIVYDSTLVLDILSHLQSLFSITDHDDYKRHIFKICKLLTLLRSEVEEHVI